MGKLKRKIGAVVLSLSGAFILWGCAGRSDPLDALRESGTLRIALVETGAPFTQLSGGQPQGIEADLARQTAEALGVQTEYMVMDKDGALDAVASGEADLAMGGLTKNSGASRELLASVSYGKRFIYLVTKAGVYVNSTADLDGQTVGICGTISREAVQDITLSGNIQTLGFSDGDQAAESLKKDEIMGFFCYQDEAEKFLDNGEMLVQSLPFFLWEEYCAQASSGNAALINGLNVLISRQLEAEETIEAETGGEQ